MGASGKLDLKGLDEYIEKLAQAGKDIDAAAAKALIAGADVIVAGTQTEVRAQKLIDKGDLLKHVQRTEPVLDGNSTYIEIGIFDDNHLPDAELTRKANAGEYGYTRGGKHFPARPYLRPGFDKNKAKAQAAMKKSLIDDGAL